jgi:ABC-type dipeptide/oligopeptide/nickel transport system permease component
MLKRILGVVFIVGLGMPVAHLLLFFLSVTAGNIASPNQYIVTTPLSAWQTYLDTLPQVLNNTYIFPGLAVGIWDGIAERAIRSVGLLAIAASTAIVCGIWIGRRVSQQLNTQLPPWFVFIASTGNTLQSLFVASSGVAIMYFIIVYTPFNPPLPINGFGWDAHLVLPVIALTLRPIMSIAHDTATLFGQASQQTHVIATQARGFSNTHIIRHHLWPAQQMTIGLICAANVRQMIAELMVVEIVFGWGGIGESIVRSIIPPVMTNIPSVNLYLDAPTFASMGIVIIGLFAIIEIIRLVLTPKHTWVVSQEQSA